MSEDFTPNSFRVDRGVKKVKNKIVKQLKKSDKQILKNYSSKKKRGYDSVDVERNSRVSLASASASYDEVNLEQVETMRRSNETETVEEVESSATQRRSLDSTRQETADEVKSVFSKTISKWMIFGGIFLKIYAKREMPKIIGLYVNVLTTIY